MVLRSDLTGQYAVADRNEPAFLRPVQSRVAEVRLRTRLRSTGDDADRLDARIAKREHDVAWRHLSHVLVELVSGSVRVLLRGPHEASANFGPVRLVLID